MHGSQSHQKIAEHHRSSFIVIKRKHRIITDPGSTVFTRSTRERRAQAVLLDPSSILQPSSGSMGSFNLSPIVSPLSVPSWMSLNSPSPTAAPSSHPPLTSSIQVTATPSPTPVSTTSQTGSALNTKSNISCSGSLPCGTITSSSSSPTSTPSDSNSPSGAKAFFASLGSSSGSIFVTTLVGLAILGVIFAISSWGLRRWCNRRRKKIIDDDTWKFLNTPKEFSKGPLDDDASSIKSLPHGYSAPLPHVLLHKDTLSTPSHVFPHSRMSQIADPNSTPQFRPFVGFHQPPRISCFMDDGQVSWMSNSNPTGIRSSMYGGVLLAPIGAPTDHLSVQPVPVAPEPAYSSPRAEMSQLFAPCVSLGDGIRLPASLTDSLTSSRQRASVFVPQIDLDDKTPLTQLPPSLATRTRQHPLARELSLAQSDISSTVEILRARVKDQQTDIRSKLIGAINLANEESCWSPSDLLPPPGISTDPTRTPYVPVGRVQPATPRPLVVQKRPSVVRYQLQDLPAPPPLDRQFSLGSCYSVTTTVVAPRHIELPENKGEGG